MALACVVLSHVLPITSAEGGYCLVFEVGVPPRVEPGACARGGLPATKVMADTVCVSVEPSSPKLVEVYECDTGHVLLPP